MKHKKQPKNFRQWRLHIRKICVKCIKPDYSETIKPFTINWELYGRIVMAKNVNN
jgi:hypothetical protein